MHLFIGLEGEALELALQRAYSVLLTLRVIRGPYPVEYLLRTRGANLLKAGEFSVLQASIIKPPSSSCAR